MHEREHQMDQMTHHVPEQVRKDRKQHYWQEVDALERIQGRERMDRRHGVLEMAEQDPAQSVQETQMDQTQHYCVVELVV